jgi:hypothetical protein
MILATTPQAHKPLHDHASHKTLCDGSVASNHAKATVGMHE